MKRIGGRLVPLLLAVGVALAACSDDATGDDGDGAVVPDVLQPNCTVDPPDPEALLPAGPHPQDGWVLVGGRLVTPAGALTPLDGLPINIHLLPGGDHLVVTESGWENPHKLWLVDAWTGDVLAEETHDHLWYGLATNRDATRIYVGGGKGNQVFVYDFAPATEVLTPLEDIVLPDVWVGAVALTPDEDVLLVADNEGSSVYTVDASTGAPLNSVVVGSLPYDLVVDEARDQLVVSVWGENYVTFVDLGTMEVLAEVETGKNPEKLLLGPNGNLLYVANSDADTFSVVDLATRAVVDTVSVGVWTPGLRGISPNHLAFSPDGQRLLVTAAGTNSVEVFDRVSLDHVGSIPTAWYPTGITASPASDLLYILGGKGLGVGPSDELNAKKLMAGNLQIVTMPSEPDLATGVDTVRDNNERPARFEPTLTCTSTPEVFPVPSQSGGLTPIEHVVLIIRENKTYDVELGDLDVADAAGDPSLTLWGEHFTPNLHALARTFSSLDNFFSNGEASAQGHHWLTAIMNNDFYEKTVPEDRSFGYYASNPVGWPEGGFIWGYLTDHGVDFVNYGEGDGAVAHNLIGLDMDFPGIMFDMTTKDVFKAEYVVSRIEEGFLPTFTYLLLPNNHTEGSSPGAPTPASMIADNDQATGMVVDALSHSPFWPKTAIFIIEDDPQQGGDHIDVHRSICLVVSPWAKRAHTSHVHGDIPAVWRTIFLILGLPPMGIYDANAAAMYDAFTDVPDFTPYTYLPRNVPEAFNLPDNAYAWDSLSLDFSKPDQSPDLARLLWQIRTGVEPPWSARRTREMELEDDD